MKRRHLLCALFAALVFGGTLTSTQTRPRARDLGVPFDGTPGALNAITDVAAVEGGMTSKDQVFAGWFSLNGNGEMTGTTWIEEAGLLEGPVFITNKHSVGVVRDAVIAWQVKSGNRSSL